MTAFNHSSRLVSQWQTKKLLLYHNMAPRSQRNGADTTRDQRKYGLAVAPNARSAMKSSQSAHRAPEIGKNLFGPLQRRLLKELTQKTAVPMSHSEPPAFPRIQSVPLLLGPLPPFLFPPKQNATIRQIYHV
jgi:hypothetical protein